MELIFGILAVVAVVFVAAAILSIRTGAKQRAEQPGESLPLADRSLLTPLRRLTQELEETVAKNKEAPSVQILGREAVQDAQMMLRKAESMLTTRRELKRILGGEFASQRAVEELEAKLAVMNESAERETLQSALAARQIELNHYQEARRGIERIEANLKQAEAALSEIKTRLSLAGSQNREAMDGDPDELRDALTRVKSLSASFEESKEILTQL